MLESFCQQWQDQYHHLAQQHARLIRSSALAEERAQEKLSHLQSKLRLLEAEAVEGERYGREREEKWNDQRESLHRRHENLSTQLFRTEEDSSQQRSLQSQREALLQSTIAELHQRLSQLDPPPPPILLTITVTTSPVVPSSPSSSPPPLSTTGVDTEVVSIHSPRTSPTVDFTFNRDTPSPSSQRSSPSTPPPYRSPLRRQSAAPDTSLPPVPWQMASTHSPTSAPAATPTSRSSPLLFSSTLSPRSTPPPTFTPPTNQSTPNPQQQANEEHFDFGEEWKGRRSHSEGRDSESSSLEVSPLSTCPTEELDSSPSDSAVTHCQSDMCEQYRCQELHAQNKALQETVIALQNQLSELAALQPRIASPATPPSPLHSTAVTAGSCPPSRAMSDSMLSPARACVTSHHRAHSTPNPTSRPSLPFSPFHTPPQPSETCIIAVDVRAASANRPRTTNLCLATLDPPTAASPTPMAHSARWVPAETLPSGQLTPLFRRLCGQKCRLCGWTAVHSLFLLKAKSPSMQGGFHSLYRFANAFDPVSGIHFLCGFIADMHLEQRKGTSVDALPYFDCELPSFPCEQGGVPCVDTYGQPSVSPFPMWRCHRCSEDGQGREVHQCSQHWRGDLIHLSTGMAVCCQAACDEIPQNVPTQRRERMQTLRAVIPLKGPECRHDGEGRCDLRQEDIGEEVNALLESEAEHRAKLERQCARDLRLLTFPTNKENEEYREKIDLTQSEDTGLRFPPQLQGRSRPRKGAGVSHKGRKGGRSNETGKAASHKKRRRMREDEDAEWEMEDGGEKEGNEERKVEAIDPGRRLTRGLTKKLNNPPPNIYPLYSSPPQRPSLVHFSDNTDSPSEHDEDTPTDTASPPLQRQRRTVSAPSSLPLALLAGTSGEGERVRHLTHRKATVRLDEEYTEEGPLPRPTRTVSDVASSVPSGALRPTRPLLMAYHSSTKSHYTRLPTPAKIPPPSNPSTQPSLLPLIAPASSPLLVRRFSLFAPSSNATALSTSAPNYTAPPSPPARGSPSPSPRLSPAPRPSFIPCASPRPSPSASPSPRPPLTAVSMQRLEQQANIRDYISNREKEQKATKRRRQKTPNKAQINSTFKNSNIGNQEKAPKRSRYA